MNSQKKFAVKIILGLGVITLLSLFTVYKQFSSLGSEYILTEQVKRHEDVLNGQAGNPWQYRIFSEVLVSLFLSSKESEGQDQHTLIVYFFIRVIQNLLIFSLSFFYFKKLGIDPLLALLGLGILGWSMTFALFDSDLSLNTYFDVIFYLLAGLLIFHQKEKGLLFLVIVASTNRETSLLIPFLLLGPYLTSSQFFRIPRLSLRIAFICFLISMGLFWGLRLSFPEQDLICPYEKCLGLDLLGYNLTSKYTYYNLFATFGVIPILSLVLYDHWPPILKNFCWILIPVWVIVHLLGAVIAETRLFLVPYVMVILPGLLVGLDVKYIKST